MGKSSVVVGVENNEFGRGDAYENDFTYIHIYVRNKSIPTLRVSSMRQGHDIEFASVDSVYYLASLVS